MHIFHVLIVAAVDAEVDKLLNDFADQGSIAREVRLVGRAMGKAEDEPAFNL